MVIWAGGIAGDCRPLAALYRGRIRSASDGRNCRNSRWRRWWRRWFEHFYAIADFNVFQRECNDARGTLGAHTQYHQISQRAPWQIVDLGQGYITHGLCIFKLRSLKRKTIRKILSINGIKKRQAGRIVLLY